MANKEVIKRNKATALVESVVKEIKPQKDLFVKLDKNTWAMDIPNVGAIVEHHGHLVFVPGVKVLVANDVVNLLVKG